MISGGWEFVSAAYAIAWSGLLLYGLSLWQRRRTVAKTAPREPEG